MQFPQFAQPRPALSLVLGAQIICSENVQSRLHGEMRIKYIAELHDCMGTAHMGPVMQAH